LSTALRENVTLEAVILISVGCAIALVPTAAREQDSRLS
jgi:hypothetical protein